MLAHLKINIEIFLLSLMSVPESNEKYPPGAATARSFVKRSVEVLNQLVHGRVGRAKTQPIHTCANLDGRTIVIREHSGKKVDEPSPWTDTVRPP